MFCYNFEVLGCEWSGPPDGGTAATPCVELRCQRRGVSFSAVSYPAVFAVSGAPEGDTVLLSLLRGDVVLAKSEPVEIGGPRRRVGVRTVPLKSATEVVCRVRIMWAVEEEKATRSMCSSNDAGGGQKVTTSAEATGPDVCAQTETTSSADVAPVAGLLAAAVPPAGAELNVPSCEPQGVAGEGQKQGREDVLCDHGVVRLTSLQENEGQLCVGGPQHTPEGFLDYCVTSTQAVGRVKAWRNLYTCPSPLLLAGGLLQNEPVLSTTALPNQQDEFSHRLLLSEGSALRDILMYPTKTEVGGQPTLCGKKRNVKWRTFVSSTSTSQKQALNTC